MLNSETETNSSSSSNSSSDNESNDISITENLLSQIDRKLILKYMKEGKSSRTYILGLEGYLKQDEQLTLMKDIQKKLGTSLLKKMTEDNKPIFGLGGDHVNTIYDYIIKKKIAPKGEIKKQ
jgi:hypothetical protein